MEKKEDDYIKSPNQFQEIKMQAKDIIESIDVGTWERNMQTGEITFSKKWSKITGYDLGESGLIHSQKLEEITHHDDFRESMRLMNEHLKGELPYYKYENRIKHKDGGWVWICERGGVISRSEDGKPLLMFGTHTDITKKKQTEEALQNYINILNHDLRNPLATIIGYSSILLEDELNEEELKKYISIINKKGKMMLQMMESYLSLAKIERGQCVLDKKVKKIGEVVDEINKNFSSLMNNKNVSIILKNLKDEIVDEVFHEKSVLIDEILVYSVVNNLLHNAMDASPCIEDDIFVHIYNEDHHLYISFYNKGEVPKEVQKKLFKKFVSTKKNGTGIGLYSARLIARAHGGDVVYQPVSGGTRFVLKIPLH